MSFAHIVRMLMHWESCRWNNMAARLLIFKVSLSRICCTKQFGPLTTKPRDKPRKKWVPKDTATIHDMIWYHTPISIPLEVRTVPSNLSEGFSTLWTNVCWWKLTCTSLNIRTTTNLEIVQYSTCNWVRGHDASQFTKTDLQWSQSSTSTAILRAIWVRINSCFSFVSFTKLLVSYVPSEKVVPYRLVDIYR